MAAARRTIWLLVVCRVVFSSLVFYAFWLFLFFVIFDDALGGAADQTIGKTTKKALGVGDLLWVEGGLAVG